MGSFSSRMGLIAGIGVLLFMLGRSLSARPVLVLGSILIGLVLLRVSSLAIQLWGAGDSLSPRIWLWNVTWIVASALLGIIGCYLILMNFLEFALSFPISIIVWAVTMFIFLTIEGEQ